MKTREKILLISQEMFNQLGEPQVSTVDIATELDISPGNLYYHFRNKEEIVISLFMKLETELNQALRATEVSLISLLDSWLHLKCLFEILWQYRFIYQDSHTLLQKNQPLESAFKSLINKKSDTIHRILDYSVESKLITISPSEQNGLVENILILTHFAMHFHHIHHEKTAKPAFTTFNIEAILTTQPKTEPLPKAVEYALRQITFTLMPFMNVEQQNLIRDLLFGKD